MPCSGAVRAALLLLCVSSGASSSTFYAGQFLHNFGVPEYGALVMGSNVHGKLDIFLDLTNPQCAKAWPTLKSAIRDNESIMEFVFHVISFSASPTSIDVAKAANLVADHSGDAEVEAFFDLVLSYHSSRGGENLARLPDDTDGDSGDTDTPADKASHAEAWDSLDGLPDAGDLLVGWVLSSSSMDPHQYESGMRDFASDHPFWLDGTSSSPSSTYASSYLPLLKDSPAVYLDGEFMMYLDGEKPLQNFELFLSSGLLSKIADATHHGRVRSGYPLWLKLQDAQLMLDDLRQESHKLAPGGSTDYYEGVSYGYYTYVKHSFGDGSDATTSDASVAPKDDDATLRSDLDEELASSVKSTAALIDEDDGEAATSLSPSSSELSETSSLSPGAQPGDIYLYDDDTVEELIRERAIGNGEMPSSSEVAPVHSAIVAEQAEPIPPPPQLPSSVAAGNGASDALQREKKQQQPQAKSVPSLPLSRPAVAIG